MSVTLACTFRPINDLDRFIRLRAQIEGAVQSIVIVAPPGDEGEAVRVVAAPPKLHVIVSPARALGRYLALQQATETEAGHILCADLDRLMRWIEVAPDEWQRLIERVQRCACLVIGRTERAFATHPQALQQTERIINLVFSDVLGTSVDLGGGARGFNQSTARFVVAHAQPEQWSDAAWPVLVHRGGFPIDYFALDCNDWETADRYLGHVADPNTQRREAEKRDLDPKQWADRVRLAYAIVEAGLDALHRPLG